MCMTTQERVIGQASDQKANRMENGFAKANLSEPTIAETEHHSCAESDISTGKAIWQRERNTMMNRMNSFREETAEDNNRTFKETTVLESHSKISDDIERRNKSSRENKGDVIAKVMSADRLGETHERLHPNTFAPSPSNRSTREIKSSGKADDAVIISGRRRQPFRDIIGKREQRREELERVEGDLRQRLDMLECSIPAVLVWNVCRMAQGAPVCKIKHILEKQFKDVAACEAACRSTPSRHYDCRVREAEAERKLALKKAEEARALWAEKVTTLEERKGKLEEAKKIQEEQKSMMDRLNEQTKALREAMEKELTDESCQHGECGDAQCKRRCLDRVSSVTSIQSEDIRCLEKLQQLAEDEIITKRDIAELERREEAYMRTLQQADELWSKVEGDTVSTASALQEQLDMKTAANQRLANRVCELEDALEKCRTRMAACRAELEKFLSIEKVETVIGRDDDVALVADKEVTVRAKVVHRPVGRPDDVATVKDDEVLAKVEVADAKTLARVEVVDEKILARTVSIDVDVTAAFEDVRIKPVSADFAVDRQVDLVPIEDAESVVRPEDFTYEEQKLKEVREYLAQLGSLEELYEDDGEACPPDFACNAEVFSPTGMTDEELIALGVDPAEPTKRIDRKLVPSEEERERQLLPQVLAKEMDSVTDYIALKEETTEQIPDVETERKVVKKLEERIVEVADSPIREVVTRRVIREEDADDSPVTTPDEEVRATEPKRINADRDVVIQRNQILSRVDAIDTIRETTEEVVEEEDLTTVTAEDEQSKIIEKDETKAMLEAEERSKLDNEEIKFVPEVPTELPKIDLITEIQTESVTSPQITTEVTEIDIEEKEELKTNKQQVMVKTKLEDKLTVPEKKETELEMENGSIPFPYIEEVTAEAKAPIGPVLEPELQPKLTKEEISADIELAEPISMEDSSQPPANLLDEKDVNGDVPLTESFRAEIGKVEIEEKTGIKETVTEDAEVFPPEKIEANATIGNLIDEESEMKVTVNDDETINSVKAKDEIISEHLERIEMKTDVPKEMIVKREAAEKVKADEVLQIPVEISESIVEEGVKKELEQVPQVDEIKTTGVAEMTSHAEIIETRETAEAPPIAAMKEIERADAEETVPIADMEELAVNKVSPVEDLVEVEKFEPSELPVPADVAKVEDVVEEKIKIEEILLIPDVKEERIEIEVEEPSVVDAVTEKKIEIEIPAPITDTIISEKIDITELPPIADIVKKEKIEVEEPSPVAEILTEELIEIEKPSPITDMIIKEKVETIQPTAEPPPPTIEKEMEEIGAVEQPELEIEISKEKYEEVGEKVTPPTELPEEIREEKEPPPMDKEEIAAEIALPSRPVVEDKEKQVPLVEKKPEIIQVEEKIPIVETRPAEVTDASRIPTTDPRLTAQPYFVIAKIEEREMLHVISAIRPPCTECRLLTCCTGPPIAKPDEITRTDVLQQTVQITTQTVSTAGPLTPPLGIISEHVKPPGLKASATEIATGDRPEITGRKMLWRKRLKDQSTVTTVSAGSQTDKTSRVSHDRVERGRTRVPTDELLRSIKIAAAGLTRGDTEREIRTINYGRRSDDTGREMCNCCLCGRVTSSQTSIRSRLPAQPQIAAKIATPAAVALKRALIPPKIDRPIPYDTLCRDCKAKIQDKMSRERRRDDEKVIRKISRDHESCACATSSGKPCRAVPRKNAIERKDQSCLAKIPRRKADVDATEQKRKSISSSMNAKKSEIEPLSPSCICFKLEKPDVGAMKKGNCHCAG